MLQFTKVKRSALVAVISGFALFFSHKSAGQIHSGKFVKKNIDSLTVFEPWVYVTALKGSGREYDTALNAKLRKDLHSKVFSLLSRKYTANKFTSDQQSVSEAELGKLFQTLDEARKGTTEVAAPPYILDAINANEGRYCLLVFLQAHYDADMAPYENIQQAMKTSRVYLNTDQFRSDLRLVIVDKHNNNIIYYNKKNSGTVDPRIPDFIKQQVLAVVKPIYYK